jgi:hypothetical protein
MVDGSNFDVDTVRRPQHATNYQLPQPDSPMTIKRHKCPTERNGNALLKAGIITNSHKFKYSMTSDTYKEFKQCTAYKCCYKTTSPTNGSRLLYPTRKSSGSVTACTRRGPNWVSRIERRQNFETLDEVSNFVLKNSDLSRTQLGDKRRKTSQEEFLRSE